MKIPLFFHKSLYAGDNEICRALDAESRGVDCHIVVVVLAPLVSGVEVVIGGSSLVGLVDNVDYLRGLNFGVSLLDSLRPMLKVAVDK